MSKYQKGIIYKLVNTVDDKFYVGSTISGLKHRIGQHKSNSSKKTHIKVYAYLNELGWDNVTIEEIERYPCSNKVELTKREQHWKDILKPELNTNDCIVCISKAEYTRKWKRNKYKNNQEYRQSELEKGKNFRLNNPNYMSTHSKNYHVLNKDKIMERKNKIVICDCGSSYQYGSTAVHKRTRKHQKYIENNPM